MKKMVQSFRERVTRRAGGEYARHLRTSLHGLFCILVLVPLLIISPVAAVKGSKGKDIRSLEAKAAKSMIGR